MLRVQVCMRIWKTLYHTCTCTVHNPNLCNGCKIKDHLQENCFVERKQYMCAIQPMFDVIKNEYMYVRTYVHVHVDVW